MSATAICNFLSRQKFKNLHDEKRLQLEMYRAFENNGGDLGVLFQREYALDDDGSKKNVIDFLIDNIGLEIKIGGSKRNIFSQLERYAKFEKVHEIILVTNVAMGLPPTICNKPAYLVKLSSAWL